MFQATKISFEQSKALTTRQEIALVRAAYERTGASAMRHRLAYLLTFDDDLAGVTALLANGHDLNFAEQILLGQAQLASETDLGDRQAAVASDAALALAPNAASRATALAMRGKAETRLGKPDDAHATLSMALDLDPHNKDACKRLAALALAAGDHEAVHRLYADLAAKGVGHARLFAAHALARARAGNVSDARAVMGADRLWGASSLAPPPGWHTIEAFNAEVADELLAHPELRYDRTGAASEKSWRVDSLFSPSAPLTRTLIESLAQAIGHHVEKVSGEDHPWIRARPSQAMLRSWCVITEGEGFENWHVHQFGWLSGAYYVQVPDAIVHGTDEAGCIEFGLPSDLAGEEASARYGIKRVRPQSGTLLLFPSHTYHRTFPHGGRDKRICVAFDLKPLVA